MEYGPNHFFADPHDGNIPKIEYKPQIDYSDTAKTPRDMNTTALTALRQKMHVVRGALVHNHQPIEPSLSDLLVSTEQIDANWRAQEAAGSQAQRLLRETAFSRQDIFSVHDKASNLADIILYGVEYPDWVDVVQAVQAYEYFVRNTFPNIPKAAELERLTLFSRAFFAELTARPDYYRAVGTRDTPLRTIYEQIFAHKDSKIETRMLDTIDTVQLFRTDRFNAYHFVEGCNLMYDPTLRDWSLNVYNRPLTEERRSALNENAAETIERLHLLRAYGITPMVVPGKMLQLRWDLAIMPPINPSTEAYDEGTVADFLFLPPNEARTDPLLRLTKHDNYTSLIRVGDEDAVMRFRLHDNGGITGHAVSGIVPNNLSERFFADIRASDAFTRLRGLFIAMAFDAVADAEIVQQVGGSVASEYNRLFQEQPNREALIQLLLRRQKALRAANVTPRHRQPTGWPMPERPVRGHRRKLPEGYKRDPGAEERARKYYKKLGIEFKGLADGENFVQPYKQGKGPEQNPFRRAVFGKSSATVHALGGIGIGPRGGKKRSSGRQKGKKH